MGIRNLHKFLREQFPNVFIPKNLNDFSGLKCAVDIASYMYKWKVSLGSRWIVGLIQLLLQFKEHQIHAFIVLDTSAPLEKQEEQKRRHNEREKSDKRILQIYTDLESFEINGQLTDLLKEFYIRMRQNEVAKNESFIVVTETQPFDVNTIKWEEIRPHNFRDYIIKRERQNVYVGSEDRKLLAQILEALHVPFCWAAGEAEATCSYLCNENKVDFVLSEDSDNVAYCCKHWVTKLDLNTGNCLYVSLELLLDLTQFDENMLRDWCIASGCDFNKNIEKIGIKKAFDIITKYKSLEEVEKHLDCSVLNYKRTREIFSHKDTNVETVPFWPVDSINKVELEKILHENGCIDQLEEIEDKWKPVEFEFDFE